MQRTPNPALSITPAFRRRFALGLTVLATLFVLRAGLRSFLGYYMNLPTVCDQPCLVTDPACKPLQLNLELKDVHARVRKMPRIWYRASVKNVTCGKCEIGADFFHLGEYSDIHQADKEDFYFRITDESGKELTTPNGSIYNDGSIGVYGTTISASAFSAIYADERNGGPREFEKLSENNKAPEGDFEGIEPYIVDETAYPEMFAKMDKAHNIELEPKEQLVAQPTKYWPNRMQMFEVQTKHYVGTGSAKVGVKLNHRIAPEPPAGFRLLERLIFLRPGRYRIQLAYNGRPFAGGHYRFETLPKPIVRLLSRAYAWLGLPEHYLSRNWNIHAESPPFEIIVTP